MGRAATSWYNVRDALFKSFLCVRTQYHLYSPTASTALYEHYYIKGYVCVCQVCLISVVLPDYALVCEPLV